MLAKGTTRLYGTWIPRSVKHAPKGITKIVSFGQQMTIKWLHDEFKKNFFSLTKDEVLKFGKDMSLYLMQDYDASHFSALHELGYLPIKIKSLPEGIETGPNIPHMTFINTVDGFGWLPLYLETIISSLAWKSSTSATLALAYKRNAIEWVKKTDPANLWLTDYMCHDFSARGLDPHSMLSSGLGHASSHKGSDTLIVIPGARHFYNESEDEVVINSVNASEHSVSTTKIFTVGEKQMIIDWLKEFPTGILSIVADTFDLWKLITEYLTDPEVKKLVLARDGKLVIRPDSGDPVDIICGKNSVMSFDNLYEEYCGGLDEDTLFQVDDILYMFHPDVLEETLEEYGEEAKDCFCQCNIKRCIEAGYFTKFEVSNKAENKGVIELLWDTFGGTTNEQGFKVLDSHIGAIYGDSITLDRQVEIYSRLAAKEFASTNILLGVGSFTYQFNTRDTFGFAAKGAWFEVLEEGKRTSFNIYKDPITDDGTKVSLKGLCAVHEDDQGCSNPSGNYFVKTECTEAEEKEGILQVIYEDGKFYNETTLTKIREKLSSINQKVNRLDTVKG